MTDDGIREKNRMRRWLVTDHLPEHLAEVVEECQILFDKMDNSLDHSAEKQAGLRFLIQAKDCFCRARIETKERQDAGQNGN